MIIPHEDTYWNDADNTLIAEADTLVYKTKVDFMTKHNIVDLPDPRSHAPAAARLHVLRHGARGRPRSR